MPSPYAAVCRWIALAGLLATGSCTLYQPLLGTFPAVRRQGDVAAMGNWQLPYGAQASVIASPVPHALVFASGGLQVYNTKRDSSNNYVRSRQYEVGAGGYVLVGQTWLSVAAGIGQGRGYRYGRFGSSDFFYPGATGSIGGSNGSGRRAPVPELLGYYGTRFVQVTTWWPAARRPKLKWGASLRLNQVRFTELSLNGIAQPLPSQYYLQNSVVVEQRLGHRFGWQATGSYGFALQPVSSESTFDRAPLRVGISLVFYPAKSVDSKSSTY